MFTHHVLLLLPLMSKRINEITDEYTESKEEEGDWSGIKKWLLTKMKNNIVLKDYSFDEPMDEWPSFDDIVYMTFLKYLESSWTGKYMIQIEALKSHYKGFYCNLMREPMRKAVLQFINANKIPPGMFGDLFIHNIFPEYMRNNVYIGDYLTHTNNIATVNKGKTLFVIRNNDSHENGKNRRRVFVYHGMDEIQESFKPGILKLPLKITGVSDDLKRNADDDTVTEYVERTIKERPDDRDDDDDTEIVSIIGTGNWWKKGNRLHVLDINGGLHIITVVMHIDVRHFYKRELIETYWDRKTSKFLPMNRLKIIAIYNSKHENYKDIFFLTDAGDLYAYLYIENHRIHAYTQILLPSEAQKIVLFNTSEKYFTFIDSNNTLFVGFEMPNDPSNQKSSVFRRIHHTFGDAIILISFYAGMILLADKSNFLIFIDFNYDMNIIRDLTVSYTGVVINGVLDGAIVYPHILSLSENNMLIMANKIRRPIILSILRKPILGFGVPYYLTCVRRKIISNNDTNVNSIETLLMRNEEGNTNFILSIHDSGYILLGNQDLIRFNSFFNNNTHIISTAKESGKWKFECMHCGIGTNMINPLKLLAFCSDECSKTNK